MAHKVAGWGNGSSLRSDLTRPIHMRVREKNEYGAMTDASLRSCVVAVPVRLSVADHQRISKLCLDHLRFWV